MFSFFLLPITCDRNVFYQYRTNVGTSGNTGGDGSSRRASIRLLQDDRQGTCLGILIHGAHLITRSGAKPSRTACPRRRAWLWPPQSGRSKTDPHLKHFSLFFPGHSRKSCRYVGLSSQGPCGRARCNLLAQAPLCSSRCCPGVCPGPRARAFTREPLPGL